MSYTLRVWVNDKLEETLEGDATATLSRFRAIVAEWPNDWPNVRWYATVNAEPGPYPERSWPIASYQHSPTL